MTSVLSRGRRALVQAATALAVTGLSAMAGPAAAQANWPERPIRIIVPYAAGQGADVLARLLAQEVAKSLSQGFVIENRAGAGGNIGSAAAAKAAPDGYTFLFGTNATNAANEFLYPNPGYNAATDFDSVALVGLLPMVIGTTAPDFPTNGIAELIARAKDKPNTLNVGLPSTTANVVFAQFVKSAQAPLFAVKYKSSAQSMTEVLGGQIPLVIDTVTAARPHVTSGKLRALGITSLKGSEMLPGVKPVSEQGVPGFDIVAWNAFFAPRGTPAAVVQKMADLLQRALQQPETRRRMMDSGVEPLFLGPAALDAFVKEERTKWGNTIKAADIRIE